MNRRWTESDNLPLMEILLAAEGIPVRPETDTRMHPDGREIRRLKDRREILRVPAPEIHQGAPGNPAAVVPESRRMAGRLETDPAPESRPIHPEIARAMAD